MSFLAAVLLLAAGDVDTVTIIGVGNRTCGAWTNAAETNSLEATHQRREFTGWLMGFLSGLNVTDEFRALADLKDGEGYRAWMDAHCAKNPLDTVYVAAATLANELINRKPR